MIKSFISQKKSTEIIDNALRKQGYKIKKNMIYNLQSMNLIQQSSAFKSRRRFICNGVFRSIALYFDKQL